MRDGANEIFLMTTADYPFEEFVEVGKAVKNAIARDMPLVANIGDFGPSEARTLVQSGFTGIYHVVRLRERVDTELKVSDRINTIKSAKDAGLDLYYCIEPIGPEHTAEEIVDAIFLAKEFNPKVMAAMRRIPLPGPPLSAYGTISEIELAKIVAIIRLVFGKSLYCMSVHEPTMLPLRAGANQLYAETGSNPRDLAAGTSRAGFASLLNKKISFSVPECKTMLLDAGWVPLEGPSQLPSIDGGNGSKNR